MAFTSANASYAELNTILDQASRPSAMPVPVTDAPTAGPAASLEHRAGRSTRPSP